MRQWICAQSNYFAKSWTASYSVPVCLVVNVRPTTWLFISETALPRLSMPGSSITLIMPSGRQRQLFCPAFVPENTLVVCLRCRVMDVYRQPWMCERMHTRLHNHQATPLALRCEIYATAPCWRSELKRRWFFCYANARIVCRWKGVKCLNAIKSQRDTIFITPEKAKVHLKICISLQQTSRRNEPLAYPI